MADDKAAAVFMSLPLEVRHAIFEHAAARNVKPKKLLRSWFEKKEVKELITQVVAANPNGPTPRVVRDNDDYESESEPVEEDGDEEDEEDDGDGNEEDDDSEEEDEHAQEDEDADGEDDMNQEAEAGDEEADEDAMDDNQVSVTAGLTQVPLPAQIQAQSTAHPAHQANQAEHDDSHGDGEDGEVDTDNQDAQNTVDHDGDSTMADEEDDGEDAPTAPTQVQVQVQPRPQPPPPPAPVVRAHRKWRHIPRFMRITHYPPPIELLLTSKQLNEEVKNWYYDVAVLRIEATGSFAHTSFFEEAFSQITEAAFSPMENIRKVEVTFVWDTTWIRADTTGCVEAIFPALLRQRSNFVYQILTQAPDLKEVVIHWHDSAQDDESANLRMDIIEPFLNLPATVKAVEHYIDADAKPNSRSIAGRRRVEFQNILDMGLDRLF